MQNTNKLTKTEFKNIISDAILDYKDSSKSIAFCLSDIEAYKDKYPFAYLYLSNMFKKTGEGIYKKNDEFSISGNRRFFYEKFAEMLPDAGERFTYFKASIPYRGQERIIARGQRMQDGLDYCALLQVLFCQYAYEGVKIDEYMSGFAKDSKVLYSLDDDMLQVNDHRLKLVLRRFSLDRVACQIKIGSTAYAYLESNPEYTPLNYEHLFFEKRR